MYGTNNFNPHWYVPRPSSIKNAIFYKTKFCPAFQKGCCHNAENCQYAHSEDELRPPPDLSKTRLCDSVLKGSVCIEGSQCPFAHSLSERRVDPLIHKKKLCGSISRGVPCIWGEKCQFVHSLSEVQDITLNSPLGRPAYSLANITPLSPHSAELQFYEQNRFRPQFAPKKAPHRPRAMFSAMTYPSMGNEMMYVENSYPSMASTDLI
eukprot:Platyproteum_vivax@DN2710_c0_g1_i1.p1